MYRLMRRLDVLVLIIQCNVERCALFRTLCAAVGDGLVHVGQHDRAVVDLVLVIVSVQRSQSVPHRARCDAADGHNVRQQADDQQNIRADARKCPAQNGVQAARDQAARFQLGAVAQQTEECHAGCAVISAAEKGVRQCADEDGQACDGRTAQTHRAAAAGDEQGTQAEEGERPDVQTPAEQSAQGGMDHAQHKAVVFEDRNQAQHAQHAVNGCPDLARDGFLLGMGRRYPCTALFLLHRRHLARLARTIRRGFPARVLVRCRRALLSLSHAPHPLSNHRRSSPGIHS